MKRFKIVLFLSVLSVFLFQAVSMSQGIINPRLPRSWWTKGNVYFLQLVNGVPNISEDYSTGTEFGSVSDDGTLGDTLNVWEPQVDTAIEYVSVYFDNYLTPDSTLYLVLVHTSGNTGKADTLLKVDSTGNGQTQFWDSTFTSQIELVAGEKDTLLWLAGSDSLEIMNDVMINFQTKIR